MPHPRAPNSLPIANPLHSIASFTTRLTGEQLDCLRRCANGNSLRFESLEIVDALVAGGYIQKNVAGVATVTAKGQHYYLGTILFGSSVVVRGETRSKRP